MKEWKTYKIGDICKTNISQYSVKEGWDEFLYLDTGNITRNTIDDIVRYSSAAELPSRARRKVICDDIIFSTVRPNQCHFGILSNPPANLLVSTGFTVITAKKEIVDPYYLYYYLTQESIVDYLHSIGEQAVSAYPSIKAQDIEDLEIELPDLSTQNNIAKTLRALDEKIQLNRQINDNLEQQAQALYKSWFVDFEPFLDGDFVESELGLIPKDWQCIQFSTFVSESKVKTGEIGIKEFSVTNSGIFPRDAKYNKSLSQSSAKNKLIQRGDLVFGMSREILNWGVMQEERGGVSSAYAVYNINSALVSSTYLELFIKSRVYLFSDLIRPAAREGQSIDKSLLQTKVLLLPPKDVLDTFWPLYNSLINQIQTTVTEIDSLGNIRDTLLPKLMSGELKINEIDS